MKRRRGRNIIGKHLAPRTLQYGNSCLCLEAIYGSTKCFDTVPNVLSLIKRSSLENMHHTTCVVYSSMYINGLDGASLCLEAAGILHLPLTSNSIGLRYVGTLLHRVDLPQASTSYFKSRIADRLQTHYSLQGIQNHH
jgi:hypothetical protein